MPGIFGISTPNTEGSQGVLADEMARRLGHGEKWFAGRCLRHQSGFHGIADFERRLGSSYASANGISLLCYGEVYSCGSSEIPELGRAGTILAFYMREGLGFLKSLNGSFAISIDDNRKGERIIASDRYGSKALFYTLEQNRLLYSSEIKAILAEPSIRPRLNVEGLAELLTFSYMLGNKTLFDGIELLPPASILRYTAGESKAQLQTYWDFEFNRDKEPKNIDTYLKEFELLTEKAVERRIEDRDRVGIFLSGGLDSRLLAGFAKRAAGKRDKRLISFTFGTRGGWQERIAAQVASKLDIENRFYEIPADSIAKYSGEVVRKGDGHIRIRDAHFISRLREVRAEVDTVLVGLFCSELFGEVLSADVLGISTKEELVACLFQRYRIEQNVKHVPGILSGGIPHNLEERAKASFVETVEAIQLDSYDEIADYWELRQRDRRYIIPISNYMNWYLDARLPYLDNELVDFAVSLPIELRLQKRLIHKAAKYVFPELAGIPWEKSGVTPDTTGLPLILAKGRRLADLSLRNLICTASLDKVLAAPRDYRAYDYWIRRGSREHIEDTLLRGSSEIFSKDYVRRILTEHMRGQRNHDQLICDVLSIYLLEETVLKSVK